MSQITCHVLDTVRGCPAAGLSVHLFYQSGDQQWRRLGESYTNDDGRVTDLLESGRRLSAGTYRVRFATRNYLEASGQAVFYPYVDVVFCILDENQRYHIPMLLSPYGYSTYRGS